MDTSIEMAVVPILKDLHLKAYVGAVDRLHELTLHIMHDSPEIDLTELLFYVNDAVSIVCSENGDVEVKNKKIRSHVLHTVSIMLILNI